MKKEVREERRKNEGKGRREEKEEEEEWKECHTLEEEGQTKVEEVNEGGEQAKMEGSSALVQRHRKPLTANHHF